MRSKIFACQRFPITDSLTSAKGSLKINNVGEKSHLHYNRFEIEQSFEVSCEFKLNEGMTISL